jgi:hypothetical protein
MKYLVLSLLFLFSNVYSQSDIPISQYLNEIASGNTDKVKMILPDLMVEYPNDPGVKLLTASVLTDAMRALKIYNEIVNEHPQSQWADDALYRIIQYHVVLGNGEEALSELNKLRSRYPTSQYIIPSADLVKTFVGINGNLKSSNYANLNRDANQKLLETEKATPKVSANTKQNNESTKSDIIILKNKESAVKKPIQQFAQPPVQNSEIPPVQSEINQVIAQPDANEDEALNVNANDENLISNDIAKVEDEEFGKDDVSTAKTQSIEEDNAEQLRNILHKQMELEKKATQMKTGTVDNKTLQNNAEPKVEKKEEAKKEEPKKEVVKKSEVKKEVDLAVNNQEVNTKDTDNKVRWGLQVAIFNSKDKAEKEKDKFISQRMRTEIITRMVDNNTMYAVVVGSYSSKANAEAAKIIINQQCNCNPIILQR